MLRQEFDQRFVGFAVLRAGGEANLDALAVLSRELGARCTRLHVQVEDQIVAAATRKWFTTMSST